MPDKAELLRALHREHSPILILPNAWDAATARLFEAEGFPAVATTSAGVAARTPRLPGRRCRAVAGDDRSGRANRARGPRAGDRGTSNTRTRSTPDDVADVVLRVIAAGAVGINLEDIQPGAIDLEALALQTDKIRAIVKASATAGVRVVINARTDVFLRAIGAPDARLGVAIERGKAFLLDAGADCVFVPGVHDADTIRELVRGIGGPVNVLASPGMPPVPALEKLGVARLSVGSGPMRAALSVVRSVARELKGPGTYASFTDHAMTFAEVNELMKGTQG